MYDAKILADSISPGNHRLTTFEVTFPRIVLAEVNTHRMLSRNSASSRAIPVAKKIAQVESDPFIPEAFGKNQKGMQHAMELGADEHERALGVWSRGARWAVETARCLEELEVHKQLANRVLEPFAWHTAILTATDWSNFFNLRVNPDAQGEFRTCAAMMKELHYASKPKFLRDGEWHLPLVHPGEKMVTKIGSEWAREAAKLSAARCARVSYLTHDGKHDPGEDLALCDRLASSGHLSPFEHPARPMTEHELELFKGTRYDWIRGEWHPRCDIHYCGNLNGWVSLRAMIPGEEDIHGYWKENP